MTELFLTRARLRQNASMAAIRSLLSPESDSARFSAAHKLVWTLFANGSERERDFLWREGEPGLFYLLSARRPSDQVGLFDLDEPKLFQPNLTVGDHLRFVLRANATISKGTEQGKRGKPCDVVMNAIHSIPPGSRAVERPRAVQEAGRKWLESRAAKSGFAIIPAHPERGETGEPRDDLVTGYRTLTIPRRARPARLGVIDFEGILEVRDASQLTETIARGLGRAKAFGCGLMLIRRA